MPGNDGVPMKGTVLVTGATGFVGRHVCADLTAAGWRVRGVVRPESGLLPPDVEPARVAGLHDVPGLHLALRNADAVVHLAARVHVMRDVSADSLAEFRRVNVDATRLLAREAVRTGASVFVFASSVKAMGESSGDGCWTEETPPRPVDAYGISKLEAERVLQAEVRDTQLRATSLRLPLVYGAGVKGNVLKLLNLVDRGVPLPLGRVRNRRSMAAVANVASAVRAVLDAPATGGHSLLVSDGVDLSTPELIRLMGNALGRPARLLPVPRALLRAAGRAGDVVAWAVPFPLTTPVVDRLLGSLCVDPSRLRSLSGWVPPATPASAMAELADWYRSSRAR
jgi:nucleoside-diphosphate-sugar epimerase